MCPLGEREVEDPSTESAVLGLQAKQLPSTSCDSSNELKCLDIPQYVQVKIWKESNELLADDRNICEAPGITDCSCWLVASTDYSRQRPYYVECGKSGQLICESACFLYKSVKICAHIVAVARHAHQLDHFLS